MSFSIADITNKTGILARAIEHVMEMAEEKTCIELNFEDFDEASTDLERCLQVVFVGQYSAGKSTIIKMLTGEEDIAIGAGITTQSRRKYHWHGLDVVDTPGIQTGLRPDHDAITYKAISKADLLVFVITNEGFDSTLINNFRKLAFELRNEKDGKVSGQGKINEMMLVINKMSRTGNTTENQELILQDLRKLLPAGVVDELKVCFLDAESYLASQAEDEDEEILQALYERSGYEDFIDTLNEFSQEKGFAGKLINPVQQLENTLVDAISALRGSTGDPNADATDDILHNSISEMRRMRRRGETQLNDIIRRYAMQIRSLGSELSAALGTEQAESVQDGMKDRLQQISQECNDALNEKIQEITAELKEKLEDLLMSDFAQEIYTNLEMGGDNETTQKAKEIFDTMNKFTHTIMQHLDKELIKKIGHFFGHKFRPWEAVKYLKWAKAFEKYLPVVGQILDIGMELWDRKKQEEAREALRQAQNDARNSFNGMADEFQRDGMQLIRNGFLAELDRLIKHEEDLASHLDVLKKNKSEYIGRMEALIKDCRTLMREIRKLEA